MAELRDSENRFLETPWQLVAVAVAEESTIDLAGAGRERVIWIQITTDAARVQKNHRAKAENQ